jgi:uncharacterized membrane protein
MLLLPAAGPGIAHQTARARPARRRRLPSPEPTAEDLALALLKEQYTRGEIDHDELDRRLHHLLSR